MDLWLSHHLDTEIHSSNDHEWDAAASALVTLCGLSGEWTDELFMSGEEEKARLIQPCGSVGVQELHPGDAVREVPQRSLEGVFRNIVFNSESNLGQTKDRNKRLKDLLEDFADPRLDLRPSVVSDDDVIGDVYEYLISRFASDSGKKGGEFYTPATIAGCPPRARGTMPLSPTWSKPRWPRPGRWG